MDNPLVSVLIITYNHEKYIAKAIESVLMQNTDFGYEILIGEDDSSDNTRQICKEYAAKYPDEIRLFLNDRKNVIYIEGQPPGLTNIVNLLKKASGKYIAICEGDDYWTDPHKLQKQVDFLEKNSDYVITTHLIQVVNDAGGNVSLNICPGVGKSTFYQRDCLFGTQFHANTWVFKRNALFPLPQLLDKKIVGADDVLITHVLRQGKGYFFNKKMSCYRLHSGGTWSQHPNLLKILNMLYYNILSRRVYKQYKQEYNKHIIRLDCQIAERLNKNNVVQFLIQGIKVSNFNVSFLINIIFIYLIFFLLLLKKAFHRFM